LERPIKDTGEHQVAVKLHHDVTAQFTFEVKTRRNPRDVVRPKPAPSS